MRAHQALPPPQQAAQRPRLLLGAPGSRQEARIEQFAERPRVDLVRLQLGLGDGAHAPGFATTTRATCGSRMTAIAARIPSPRAPRGRLRGGSARTARAGDGRLDPPRGAMLALLFNRHLTEVAVDLQRHRAHVASSFVIAGRRRGWQTTQTDPCSRHNRASRRGPVRSQWSTRTTLPGAETAHLSGRQVLPAAQAPRHKARDPGFTGALFR
jgi:hypothetical protein